jgi:protein PhnA
MLCDTCKHQLENPETTDINHWRCLNDSMWSQIPAVQVVAWRQLKRLSETEGWAHDLLDMMYMEEDTQKWAEIGMDEDSQKHVDCNGAELKKGDAVTIIKDLPVKGSSMVVKQGTVVRNIGLAQDDPELFSGKVDGQSIWLRCEFARKK